MAGTGRGNELRRRSRDAVLVSKWALLSPPALSCGGWGPRASLARISLVRMRRRARIRRRGQRPDGAGMDGGCLAGGYNRAADVTNRHNIFYALFWKDDNGIHEMTMTGRE